LTLLETAVLISIGGIVLASAIPAFLREVRASKISEAGTHLGDMHRAAAAYYATGAGHSGGRRGCIPDAAGPAPPKPSPDAIEIDFGGDSTPGHTTWQAIGFLPQRAVRYRYSLENPAGSQCAPHAAPVTLTFVAEGDLDDDGVLSRFERSASNAADADELAPVGALRVQRRVE